MSYLDTPFERCETMRCYCLLDQTQKQCSREHCCPKGTVCPLAKLFEIHPGQDSAVHAASLANGQPPGKR